MLNTAKKEFVLISKRILQARVSSNQDTLIKHKNEIIEAYIKYVQISKSIYILEKSVENKQLLVQDLKYIARKFRDCLQKLNCKYNLSKNLYDLPDPASIFIIGIEINASNTSFASEIDNNLNQTYDQDDLEIIQQQVIMSTEMSSTDFLKLASSHINKTYTGDPLGLNSFIDSINLLISLATTNTLRTLLLAFIKTKIDGRAREFISETDNSVELIKTALITNIKPDNSKVVEGRMLSLRLNVTNQQDFATKADELAEALRRSLIIEGMSHTKANEITIDKTIELCRANARSDLVKSVLEASTFNQPKEVIAKLLIQTDKAKKEHQILSFKSNPRHQSQNKIGPKWHQNSTNRFNNRGNNSNHNNNNNNQNHSNFRYNNRNNQNGQRRQLNMQNNGGYRNRNFNSNNDRFIRLTTNSGNEERPAQTRLGGQNSDIDV